MSDRELIADIVTLVNDSGTLTPTARLDFLDATGDAASVQQSSGTRWLSRFMDGSGLVAVPFAVLLRTATGDTATRLDAAGELYALAEHLEALAPADPIMSIRGEGTPYMTERGDDDSEVWRMAFVLESLKRAPSPDVVS